MPAPATLDLPTSPAMRDGRSLPPWRVPVSLAVVTCLAALLPWATQGAAPPAGVSSACLRRPVGAAFLRDGKMLCVANQRSGTVSLVDLPGRRVVAEVPVGGRLTALAALADRSHVLV